MNVTIIKRDGPVLYDGSYPMLDYFRRMNLINSEEAVLETRKNINSIGKINGKRVGHQIIDKRELVWLPYGIRQEGGIEIYEWHAVPNYNAAYFLVAHGDADFFIHQKDPYKLLDDIIAFAFEHSRATIQTAALNLVD